MGYAAYLLDSLEAHQSEVFPVDVLKTCHEQLRQIVTFQTTIMWANGKSLTKSDKMNENIGGSNKEL